MGERNAASTSTTEVLRLVARYGGPRLAAAVGADRLVKAAPSTAEDEQARAEAMVRDLEKLGPTYVKLGQVLASRPDLVAEPYRTALARLHNDVEPLEWAVVEATLNEELVDWRRHFAELSVEPLAAASIGQVHRGRTHDGRDVAVKVQRPGVRNRMLGDLGTWIQVARLAEAGSSTFAAMRPVATLHEVRAAVIREFNYEREAANLRRLASILGPRKTVRVPGVVRASSSLRVLTMDYIEGRKITDSSSPLPGPRGIELADALFEVWLDQIVVHGFFHADPHPGNVLLTPDGRLGILDAGMVGVVPNRLRRGLVKLLLALADGRAEDAAETFVGLAADPEGADPIEFREEVARVLTEVMTDDLGMLQAGALLLEMQQIAVRTRVTVPPSFTLIGKALLQLDEIGRSLDEGFRPDEAIRTHAATLFQQTLTQAASGPRMLQALLEVEELADALPHRAAKILGVFAENRLRVQVGSRDLQRHADAMTHGARTLAAGMVLAICLLGLAWLSGDAADPWPAVGAALLVVAGCGAGLWLWGGLLWDR